MPAGDHGPVTPSAVELDRRAHRAGRARRSTAVAVLSTLVFAAVALVAITSAPGWPRTRESFLDPGTAAQALPRVLAGLWLVLYALVLLDMPSPSPVLLGLSLAYIAYYLVASLVLTLRRPRSG